MKILREKFTFHGCCEDKVWEWKKVQKKNFDTALTRIHFGLASHQEIRKASISDDCPINRAGQLSNPFLGLPLDNDRCESCRTAEPRKCEAGTILSCFRGHSSMNG